MNRDEYQEEIGIAWCGKATQKKEAPIRIVWYWSDAVGTVCSDCVGKIVLSDREKARYGEEVTLTDKTGICAYCLCT